jgi:hypothetical protein
VNLTVEKATPTIGLSLSRTKVHPGQRIRATVRITTVAGIAATGPVSIRRPNGRVLARGEIVDGVAVLKWRNHRHHGFKVRAVYRGDANYLGGTSAYVKVKVTG